MSTSTLGSLCARTLLSAACGLIIVPALTGAQATGTALVRHAPVINGTVDGSIQQMLGEGASLNTGARITNDWLVLGTPNVVINGSVTYGGSVNGTGGSSPTNYTITLNSGATLGHVVRRTNAVPLPSVVAPPVSTGTRSVTINTVGQSVGDWATLRNLTLSGNVGNFIVPAGTYGTVFANGACGITVGVAGATQPATYNFQSLTFNSNAQLRVVGPVVLTVAGSVTVNSGGYLGATANPSWLTLKLSSGGVTLNSSASFFGYVTAPNGMVIVNSSCALVGGLISDRLTVNSGGTVRLDLTPPVNQPPVARAQSVSTAEDTATAITLSGSDPDGSALSYQVASGPAHGALSPPAGDGMIRTYTPEANWSGTDWFTFRVSDGILESEAATVSITVLPINDAPITNGQIVITDEDTPSDITLTGYDVESSPLVFEVTVEPQYGTFTPIQPGGAEFVYQPFANYFGSDSFKFRASDEALDSIEVEVPITVTPVNDAPKADSGNDTTLEDQPKIFALVGTDVDNLLTELAYTIVADPAHGTIVPGNGATFMYSPSQDFHGTDSFTYLVRDPDGLVSNEATFAFVVEPVNDAPTAASLALETNRGAALPFTLSASDVDGDALAFAVGTPQHGTIVNTGAPGVPEQIYIPSAGFAGDDAFSFTVNDGVADPVTGMVSIHVINHAPLALSAPLFVTEDVARNFVLTATDGDTDALTYLVVDQPQHGQLSGVAPNLVYTPNHDFHGNDSFEFQVSDGASESGRATIAINVESVPDAPTVTEEITISGGVISTGDSITISAEAASAEGAITRVEFFDGDIRLAEITSGPFVFHWSANSPGNHELWVRVHDAAEGTADSTRTIVTVLAGLPYVTDFESNEGYHLGGVDGQLGWSASGIADVTLSDASSGAQSLALVGGSTMPEATQLIAPNGQAGILFIDFFFRPLAGAVPAGAISFDGQAALLAAITTSSSTGELYLWNGDGTGGGVWIASGFGFAIDGAGVATTWHRLSLRKDYAAKEWDLYVNGRMVQGGLRFLNDQVDRLGRLMFVGPIVGSAHVDNIYAGAENPLFADADHDGIDDVYEAANGMDNAANDRAGDLDGDGLSNLREFILGTRANSADSDGDGLTDAWEVQYGLDPTGSGGDVDTDGDGLSNAQEFALGTDPTNADSDHDGMPDGWEIAHGFDPRNQSDGSLDHDGDGVSNRDEFLQGTDPADYYNGILPQISSLVLADGKLGPNGELSVRIAAPDGTLLINAPVTFNATEGGHKLARSPGEPGFTELEVRSGDGGVATVYVEGGN